MELMGQYRLAAPREAVFAALNDPSVLAACIPGCRSLVREEDGSLSAVAVATIGPLTLRFAGTVRLEDVTVPEGYRLVGEGKGGVAGFARGAARVRLAEDGGHTVLSYVVEEAVGGRLVHRLIDASARRLLDRFFTCLDARIAERQAGEDEERSGR